MSKYIIVGYSNPDLKTSKADIKVLCTLFNRSYWTESTNKDLKEYWKLFNTRSEADKFIKEARLECCISYGVKIEISEEEKKYEF